MRELLPAIEEYIQTLETWQQHVFYTVRELILASHPMVTEHFIYTAPFYKFHGLFCYFSVLKKGKKTVWGIVDGAKMVDPYGLLRADENQKQIRHLVFEKEKENPTAEQILFYLLQGIELRENQFKKK